MWFCWKCQSRYPIYRQWCAVCQDGGTIAIEPVRPQVQMRAQLQVASARELVARKWTTVESRSYPDLAVSRGALVALWGQAGGGKSTFATRYLDGLQGAVVYGSFEEKLGPTLAGRLERCGVTRASFHAVGQASMDELVAYCREVRAVALVVDSIPMTAIRPEDLRRLLEASGVDVLVYVLHATKENGAAGANTFLHEADVVVEVTALAWTLRKSRYQNLDGTARPVLLPVG